MSEQFLGEIRLMSFNFAPKGWALCNGQLMSISTNQALFALLGTTYGGNGIQTFALPDFRGRVPLHFGNGMVQGQAGGSENVTLLLNEIPAHTHTLACSTGAATTQIPTGNVLGLADRNNFEPGTTIPNTILNANTIGNAGSNQPHNNMQPSEVLSFCIAIQGIFPSPN